MDEEVSVALPTASEPPTTEELIALLRPDRNYGSRTYEGVVEEVRAGSLYLQPGHGNLPVIRNSQGGLTVKGSGLVLGSGSKESSNRVRAKFNAMFDEDEAEWYAALRKAGIVQGDPRAIKIAYEMRIGKPGESRSSGDARILDRLFELATAKGESRSERPITVVEVKPE